MKKYKITTNKGKYLVKATSIKDAMAAINTLENGINQQEVEDDRLSPMTYKKLKEMGYVKEDWKGMTQEQANKIVQGENTAKQSNSSKAETEEQKQNKSNTQTESSSTAQSSNESLSKSVHEYNNNLIKKYNVKVDELPKPKKPLAVPEGEILWGMIHKGYKLDIDDLNNNPIIQDKKLKLNKLLGTGGKNATINKTGSDREELRDEIAENIASQGSIRKVKNEEGKLVNQYVGPVDKGFRAEIVIGPPAAGKSSVIVNKVSQQTNSRVLDSDDVKKQIPEFDNGNGAGLVHQESSDDILEKRVIPQFAKNGKHTGENLIIPIVGKKPRAAEKYFNMLKEAGYTVHLSYNEVPAQESASRAVSRFLEEGRFLDPEYIKSVGNKPSETYEYLKKNVQFDSFSKYNNNVPFGTPAEKIEKVDAQGNKLEWEDWQ